MPPKKFITFVWNDITITMGLYCSSKDLEEEGLKHLSKIVNNPRDFKIKL